MAFQHIFFSAVTEYGGRLRSALTQAEDGIARLIHARDTITFMIDGDGSNASQFAEVASRYQFPDNASAKAAWDELNSCLGKLTTDASVSSVASALAQAFNKLR